MNDMNDEDKINFILNMAKLQGVATASVKDGTIIALNKEKLDALFAKNPDQPMLVIFSKRPTSADAAN